jgi:putative membrane protein
MQIRRLKSISKILGGLACLSLPLFAASDPAKIMPTDPVAAPLTRDSLNRMQPGSAAVTGGAQDTAQFSDARILTIVNTVDQHEIDAAEKALKKKTSAEVRDYAQMLKKEHSANLAKSRKLAKTLDLKPAKSDIADSLKAKGGAEEKTLASLKGAEFEKAYVDAMVKGHTEVLDMLDTKLIPNSLNDSLKSHLTEARGHVASHLEHGKRLQGAQASTPAE